MDNKLLYACYASSDYYARETGISMIGFFENNPDYDPKEFFILDYGILEPNKERLNNIAAKYGKYITYLPAKQILEDIQRKLNLTDFRGSLATHSRAFIDKIMPDYVEYLLYIDSDTVVTGSISELRYFEMKSECMAGIFSTAFSEQISKGELTLYSRNKHYYGCGIVFFNLYNWRQKNCYGKILKMLSIKKTFPCADQTLINNALDESCFKKLPLKFNYTTHIFSDKFEFEFLKGSHLYSESEIIDAVENPVVVHYPGRQIDRPWFKSCTSRRKEDYLKYKNISPWKEELLYDNDTSNKNGFRSHFGIFIHFLETKSSLYYLLKILNIMRNILGPVLRSMRICPPLAQEGIES